MSPEKNIPRTAFAFLGYVFTTLPLRLRFAIVGVSLLTGFAVLTNICMMYGFKLLVDGLQAAEPAQAWEAVKRPFLIVALCCFGHTAFYRVRGLIDSYSFPETQNRLREILSGYMLRHSHDYFHNRFAGELANKIGNVNRAYYNILWERLQNGFIPAIFAAAGASVALWRVDPSIVFILWGAIACFILSGALCGRAVGRAAARVADRESDIVGQLVDTVSNVASVKNFDRAEHELGLLGRLQKFYIRDYRRQGWLQMWFWGLFDVIITSLVLGFIWRVIGGRASGHMTLGDVTLCVTIAWDQWYRLSYMSWNLLEMAGDRGRLQEALDEIVVPHEIGDAPDAKRLAVTGGGILFRHVGFSHKSGARVFGDLNLSIRPAEKVGLVGLSGAGKTTLCQLLLRNYELESGEILIDGQDIRHVTQDSLRRAIAVIPQDPSLFHRSLKDNILYGLPDAPEDAVIAAARAAQADPFIVMLREGYDTLVGERGVKLSGGQRQRISIARAILKNAPILILDEATSALDSQTERQIQAALGAAMEGRTVLVIAHRLSTLAHLDRLVVLKDGKVEEEGTLAELLARGGHFADLWRCQADGFLPEKL